MSFERDQEPMGRPPLPPEPDEMRRPQPRRRAGRSRALPIFIALFALGAFGGIVWYAYNQGQRSGASDVAPIIKADEGPTKSRPEQPGGMQVPHQDKQVFQRLLPEGQAPQQVERLLPPPPEPMQAPTPPPAPPPAAAPATPPAAPPAQATGPAITPAPTSPVTPVAPAEQTAQAPAAQPAAPTGTPAQQSPAVPERAPTPQPPTALTPAPTPSPTPSTPPAATPPAAASSATASTPPVSGGRFKVQLGAVRSAEAATQEWNRLKGRYKGELGNLTLSTQTVEVAGKGTYHRVQAGPLDEATATKVCDALKAQKQACLIVRP